MRNVLDERCRENYEIQFRLNIFFPPKNGAVYVIMWEIVVEHAGSRDNMAHAHCMLTAQGKITGTRSE
jgi:hypothetical protein